MRWGVFWFFFLFSLSLWAESPWEGKVKKVLKKVRATFVSVGGGSGVLISPEGLVLTNHHVTRGRKNWWVVLAGGRICRAELLGYDPRGDLALLKLLEKGPFPYAEFGDSEKLKVGTPVIALGNPWGLAGAFGNPSVTFGFVSAVHRYQGGYGDCFQINAPINPGNSGGPTFDLEGKLLGINGQIRTRFAKRVFSGIGLVIPVHQIRRFLPLLKQGGEVRHGQLPRGLRFSSRPFPDGSVLVERASLDPASPLKKGDRILRFAGLLPICHNRILGIVSTYPPGSRIRCLVLRKGKKIQLELPVKPIPTYAECLAKGIPFRYPHTPYLGLDFGPSREGGVLIVGVIAQSPADQAGIQAGDILLSFQGTPVKHRWVAESLLGGTAFGEEVELKLKRKGKVFVKKVVVGNSDDYPLEKYSSRLQRSTPSPSLEGEKEPGELRPLDLGLELDESEEGEIFVKRVLPGSLAEKHGFQKGDVLLEFNGEVLEDLYDFETKLLFVKKGETLKFLVRRLSKGEEVEVKIQFPWLGKSFEKEE